MLFEKIDVRSADSITSAINFFDVPPTNVSISNASYREYLTLNPLTSRPFHFKIFAGALYIDMNKSYILTRLRIRKYNAQHVLVDLGAADVVATIQNIGSSCIKNLKILLNGREVSDSNSLYMYRSYFNTELTYPQAVKDTYLNASGYYSDGLDQNSSTSEGFLKRRGLFAGSRVAEFITRIDADLFNQVKFLIILWLLKSFL